MLAHNSYFDGKVQSVGFERNGRKDGRFRYWRFHFDTGVTER